MKQAAKHNDTSEKLTVKLPPTLDGTLPTVDLRQKHMVIVGANGAGKSRFARRMAADLADKSFRMSALTALYDRREPSESSLIDRRYLEAASGDNINARSESTQLERVMWLLMRDEMLNLLDYKLRHVANENSNVTLRRTRLDEVIGAWQDIFPDNKILIESGKLLFARRLGDSYDSDDSYSALKLSAGERAVIYYLGAITFAPHGSVVFVDSPEMFLHPTIMQSVWNRIEILRPDCTFVYTTHDLEFASSRTGASVVWVRSFEARRMRWDYTILPKATEMTEDIYAAILGARKPVLFIEGDERNSIDAKLYSLVFSEFSVRPLGSCNKVIEATRTFNDLRAYHQLDSYGIVDRDRRDAGEVEYLRRKRVMVPDVAEVENILMLEDVIRAVAHNCGKDENRVFAKVRRSVVKQFASDLEQQALLHTRHRVKRTMEYRVDGRFSNVDMLEKHIYDLLKEVSPRTLYDNFVTEFQRYVTEADYDSILRVYNQKSMLPGCNVAGLCGLSGKEEYIDRILKILRSRSEDARRIVAAVRHCFSLPEKSPKS
ncbi:MAG: DUF4435 domain-containing protein [Bacteroides sp.]|nr:DUF4435 domain-containing protein [Bacteroides sp.]MCM1412986.1 DUF4435 domain-containing protein [Bacteroides sp.]MCM1471692.1 DUF4435 domain-containing protein [Bacteroides sp.]